MTWSWKIATVSGIPIYLHGTFLLLIGFVFVRDFMPGHDLASAFAGVLFVLAIFATVILHELGHALTAKRYGIQTRDITLLPIGGLARIDRMPDVPRQELWVALAGPAVNVVIAGLVYFLLVLPAASHPIPILSMSEGTIERFAEINLWLAGFNLIPAFPMDGGRALRALVAERTDYVRATQIAAGLGQGLALIFGFVGLFFNPFLLFIALFVWMGASSESLATQTRSALAGVPITHAMITDFRTLDAHDSLQRAIDLVLAGSQRDFPVLHDGRLVGILTRDALTSALAQSGPSAMVADVMDRTFQVADVAEMLEPAYQRLQGCRCQVLPVLRGERLAGLLTPDNVTEFVMLRGALRRGARAM
jgi:Zn-dependent protease/predicted transcriptional regulator